MSSVRCPVLVGRRTELTALRTGLAAARLGRGQTVVLAGPAGIGKSRLAREVGAAAAAWDVPVLVGRAVQGVGASAFRPLVEALLAGLRQSPDVADEITRGRSLRGVRSVLGRLLPQWRSSEATGDEPVVVLAEAALRLLVALAGDRGLVLVLEDMHWSDPETLAVVEYLADNISGERLTLVVTVRDDGPDPPAVRLAHALVTRHTCTLFRLGALSNAEITEMAAACLGASVPKAVDAALQRRSSGTPLLIEELLAGPDPALHVPDSFAESVADRLGALPDPARRCIEAAAVLGERVDRRLLGDITDQDERELLEAIRAATACGLLEFGDDPGELRFRHALSRDAVLAAMLPVEQVECARRGLVQIRRAHPKLDGHWCDLAADLAVRAREDLVATELLLETGRRNLSRGALESAEATLRRAGELAPADPRIQDGLAEVFALAGRTDEAAAVTANLLGLLRDNPVAAGEARIRLARVHATAGDWAAADAELAAAREVGADPLRVAVVGAQVAISDARISEAAELAAEALAGAEREDRPAVAVDALLLLGRLARRDDLREAERLCGRARALADEAGLPVAAARAAYETAITNVQESLRLDMLAEARERAWSVGDLAAVAVIDLEESAIRIMLWEPEQALTTARRSVDTSRRLHLATLPKALALIAAAETLRGHQEAAEAAAAEALALAPADTHLNGDVWHVRANRALNRADDQTAYSHLNRAMTEFGRRPNQVTGSPAVGLWVLVTTVLDRDRNWPPETPDPVTCRWNRGLVRFAEAVGLGRRGEAAAAEAAFAQADQEMRSPTEIGWHLRQARRLTATAAITDGWGDPARWVLEDLLHLEERGGEDRWCAVLRGLLRRSGAVVPRRGRGESTVPSQLRELGVTSRETDVLALAAEGHGNRAIAERLFLSPRTIEKHIEHLLAKTGRTRRTELIADGPTLLSGTEWGGRVRTDDLTGPEGA